MGNADVIKRLRTMRLDKQRQVVSLRHKVSTNADAYVVRELERDEEALRCAITALWRSHDGG